MIIDASVAFKLIVEEPGTAEANAWLARAEFVGPGLIHSEVANALWKRVRIGELPADVEYAASLADLQRMIRTVDESSLIPRALQIAIEIGHPVYDCVYLALAEAEDDILLTADARLIRVVAKTPYTARVRKLGK